MNQRHSLGGQLFRLPLLLTMLALLASVFLALPAQAQQAPDPNTDPEGYEIWKLSQSRTAETSSLQAPAAPSARDASDDVAAHGGGLLVPYMNDGSWTLFPANDDGSTGFFPLPFTFELYGSTYNNVCLNNNGNVTFDTCFGGFTPSGFPLAGLVMVAPFWGDVDTRNGGEVAYKQTTLDGQTVFVAHWENVSYFAPTNDLRNTFQVVIADGPTLPGGNNVCFSYGNMDWTTGGASGGSGGLGGSPATVGANRGNGVDFFQYGRFNEDGTAYDGPGGNNDGVDFLDNGQVCFDTGGEGSSNIPPVVLSEPDSPIMVAAGDPINFTVQFIPPEVDQTIASVTTSDAGDVECETTFGPAGGVTTVTCSGSIAAGGMYTIDVEATDDGMPQRSTTVEVDIIVEGDEPEATCEDLILSDVAAAGDGNAIAIRNTGLGSIDLDASGCSLAATYQNVYVSFDLFGDLASGEETVYSDFGQIRSVFGGLAILDRDAVMTGTSIPAIQPNIIASLVYLGNDVIYGFFHRNEAIFQAQCDDFSPMRYHPFAQSQCAALARGDGDGPVAITHADLTEAMFTAERGATAVEGAALPTAFGLSAAYPNPMTERGSLTVDVPEAASVRVVVYDVLGRAVATLLDEAVEAGRYEVSLDAASLAPGTYLVRLAADSAVATQRVTVVR
ncbi:MAG: nidogen-like domain-containing protein [Rhodothermales bacterium]